MLKFSNSIQDKCLTGYLQSATMVSPSVNHMQIISRQEPVKSILRNKTLHEWMCFESETVIKYNWCDVAVHDRKIVNKMRPGDTRLWIINEFGSHFLPMYCKLYEQQKQEESEYDFSVIEVHMLRFMKDDRLAVTQNEIARATSQFYFITKGDGDYDYSVTPTNFNAVLDLVFCGKANQFLN